MNGRRVFVGLWILVAWLSGLNAFVASDSYVAAIVAYVVALIAMPAVEGAGLALDDIRREREEDSDGQGGL